MKKVLLILILYIHWSEEAKILGIFPIASHSHYSLGNALLRGLAEAGHDVTMISPHNDLVPTKNGSYKNVVLTGLAETHKARMKKINHFEEIYFNSFTYYLKLIEITTILHEKINEHPNVKQFLNSSQTFDVVIVEQISCEGLKYFAHHFNAHLVLFSSVAADSKLNYLVGNPTMLSYNPQIDTDFPREMSLCQRIHNTMLYLLEAAIMHFYWIPHQDKLVKKYFPDAPLFSDINDNVSLILVNSHESIQPSIPLVRNIIPIGGFHVKKPKPLPKHFQEYLDNATEGAVYVSFGSTVQGVNMPIDKKNVLINAIGKLKQKVLLKWENETDTNWPSNIMIANWFPQIDVLAHPNVKLFVTQGGLLSLTEAVYNGVPVLVFPVAGDQGINAHNVVLDGYGQSISFHDKNFTEKRVSAAIKEILNNPKYKENAKHRSKLFHDRPIAPIQEAVYWIEYVIRHNGARHLRVAGKKLHWYQHYLIDVAAIIISIVLVSFIFVVSAIICLLRCFIKREDKKDKKRNNAKKVKRS